MANFDIPLTVMHFGTQADFHGGVGVVVGGAPTSNVYRFKPGAGGMQTFLMIENQGVGDVRVVVHAAMTIRPANNVFPLQAVADRSYTVDNTPDEPTVIGPFHPAYIDSNGYVNVTLDPVDVDNTDYIVQMRAYQIRQA